MISDIQITFRRLCATSRSADQVTTSQLAVNGQIEEGQIPLVARDL